jgi:hypothetical protein
MRKPRRSWKTSACGAIAVIATAVIGADFGPIATKIASCAAAAATGLGLLFARDNNVSSIDVAAVTNKEETKP